jgi:hypothetical protein
VCGWQAALGEGNLDVLCRELQAVDIRTPLSSFLESSCKADCLFFRASIARLQGLFPPSDFLIPNEYKDYRIAGKFRVPVGKQTFHIGNIGTTPKAGIPVNSNAPFRTGATLFASVLLSQFSSIIL